MWSLGFLLILEPFETDNATVPNPVFHFVYVPVSGLPSSEPRSQVFGQLHGPRYCHQTRL